MFLHKCQICSDRCVLHRCQTSRYRCVLLSVKQVGIDAFCTSVKQVDIGLIHTRVCEYSPGCFPISWEYNSSAENAVYIKFWRQRYRWLGVRFNFEVQSSKRDFFTQFFQFGFCIRSSFGLKSYSNHDDYSPISPVNFSRLNLSLRDVNFTIVIVSFSLGSFWSSIAWIREFSVRKFRFTVEKKKKNSKETDSPLHLFLSLLRVRNIEFTNGFLSIKVDSIWNIKSSEHSKPEKIRLRIAG